MARDPESGIKLTDTEREYCLACTQGKQTKNVQSNKDTGKNAPIDFIVGVIFSDLMGPMTPRDRLGNRYLVNVIDHRSNYCRVFLTKTKAAAAMKLKHFLAAFERQFNCRIHVLRTDGVGEYKTLDVFCKTTGVLRQVSEPNTQASNDKADRMHRTIMNLVRSMVFASGLPLRFWGDAAEYALYILNRSPTKGNIRHVSPIEMLSNMTPALGDIVVFGMPYKNIRGVVNAVCDLDPKNYGEAMMSQGKHKWMTAVSEELKALEENGVWEVMIPPTGSHVSHNKWVFKTKKNANGDVERYKARLVACGNEQLFGVDCTLTFAAVIEITAEKEPHLDVYMKVPEGMKIDEMDLKRYGVNDSSNLATLEQAIALEINDKDELTIVGVYVDDLLLTGASWDAVDKFFKELSALGLKDLWVENKFLGLRMSLDEEVGYVLDQEVSIDLLLREYGLEKANGV
uniref:Uncharacterized protein AlNc14C46G3754 n=1 Tax=Albugo laibachii Nc14 TaxID=890382 RepID=F0WAP0_9STRA|nr:hypothetical protein ALNC14_043540 [Albugo laibachii Nc14]|eukprot:CCA18211.1 hypothetical protein ALNC14_043540 [Albugo laibachii Nc14]